MKRTHFLILVLLISGMFGCGFLGVKQISRNTDPEHSVRNGKVVQAALLKKGGDLLILPFTPGSDIAANEDLDRISLKIVQGVASVLDEGGPLKVAGAESAGRADFILKGRVTEKRAPTVLKKWMLRKHEKILGVKGELVDRRTGAVILFFSHTRETAKINESFETLGLVLGEDIGGFIRSNADSKGRK